MWCAQPGPLCRERLLHLHDQLGSLEKLVRGAGQPRSVRRVLLIAEAAPAPGPTLHEHLVPAVRGLGDTLGCQPDAVLLALDLPRHASIRTSGPSSSRGYPVLDTADRGRLQVVPYGAARGVACG